MNEPESNPTDNRSTETVSETPTRQRYNAPEPQLQWVRKVLDDTFKGFVRAPVAICFAALILALPVLFSPPLDYKNLISFDAKGIPDFSKALQYIPEISTVFLLALFANIIAYGLVYRWADRMRLGRTMSLSGYLEGLAAAPRILFGLVIEILIVFAAMVVTVPLLLLMLFSKIFLLFWVMLMFGLIVFLIIKWVPKFDYFLAGMGLTDEPVSVLLHEWWQMPKWLWTGFLWLMVLRLFSMFAATLITIPVSMALKGTQFVDLIPNFLVNIAVLIFIAANAIAFARGRDKWAELTEGEQGSSEKEQEI